MQQAELNLSERWIKNKNMHQSIGLNLKIKVARIPFEFLPLGIWYFLIWRNCIQIFRNAASIIQLSIYNANQFLENYPLNNFQPGKIWQKTFYYLIHESSFTLIGNTSIAYNFLGLSFILSSFLHVYNFSVEIVKSAV